MPLLRSHTHLQATQSQAQTKAYKRVCLPNHTDNKSTCCNIMHIFSGQGNDITPTTNNIIRIGLTGQCKKFNRKPLGLFIIIIDK